MNLVFPTLLFASAVAASVIGSVDVSENGKAAQPQIESGEGWNGDLAWVDPVITGPVSDGYARIRKEAGCDEAKWPDIPQVCFPK